MPGHSHLLSISSLAPDVQRPLLPRVPVTLAQLQQNSSSSELVVLVLRARGMGQREASLLVLDSKGKELLLHPWEKIYARACTIALYLQNKTKLRVGDRVCLVYRSEEMAEFMMLLFGCFIGGYVAVPVLFEGKERTIFNIMTHAESMVALMSDSAYRRFEVLINNFDLPLLYPWPPGMKLLKSSGLLLLKMYVVHHHQLAYIEFTLSPEGDIRGVVVLHRTILHQMKTLADILNSRYEDKLARPPRQTFLSTLSPMYGIGLIIGVLFQVHQGNTIVWAPQLAMGTPGLYANIITRLRVTLLLADYVGLKEVVFNYQQRPNQTRAFNPKIRVDLSLVQLCLINASTVDGEFLRVIAERWLLPLGCLHPNRALCPMLTLGDCGGMVVLMRDWLPPVQDTNNQEDDLDLAPVPTASTSGLVRTATNALVQTAGSGNTVQNAHGIMSTGNSTLLQKPSDISEVMIDREQLSRNVVKVLLSRVHSQQKDTDSALRVGAFGYPLPDATLAIVNPETLALAKKMEVGEIWIDSLCLSGGLYEGSHNPASIRATNESIFHAQCTNGDGVLLDKQFLRTGLLGFTFKGKVYVLGLYEDRIRQLRWVVDEASGQPVPQTKYHYAYQLSATIAEHFRGDVYDCTFFDISVNDEFVPVAMVEAEIETSSHNNEDGPGVKPTNKEEGQGSSSTTSNISPEIREAFDDIALRMIDVLRQTHRLDLYCVLVTERHVLPRIQRLGGSDIANVQCKESFRTGNLSKAHFVKFNFCRLLHRIPHGDDVVGGIWLPYLAALRERKLGDSSKQVTLLNIVEQLIDRTLNIPLNAFPSIMDILNVRVAKQGDEVAFNYIGKSDLEHQKVTWKKFDERINALMLYMINKTSLQAGSHVALMYSLLIDFVVAVYACFKLGMVPVPVHPLDLRNLAEEYATFKNIIADYKISTVFMNEDIERLFKLQLIGDALRKDYRNLVLVNTTKTQKSKVMPAGKLQQHIMAYASQLRYRTDQFMCLVWVYLGQKKIAAAMNHSTIIRMCKVIKETLLMGRDPLLGCVRHATGLGFLQTALLGVFTGARTNLLLPFLYRDRPDMLFMLAARNGVKDLFVTGNMLIHMVDRVRQGLADLLRLTNLMVYDEGRNSTVRLEQIAAQFAHLNLLPKALLLVFCHPFNPMVALRLYMPVTPMTLYLDPFELGRGLVRIVNPSETSNYVTVLDLGLAPVNSQIVIVNPTTLRICREGEMGEVWVCLESNLVLFTNGLSKPKDYFRLEQFNGKTADGNPDMTYVRTGEIGFLHPIRIRRRGQPEHASVKLHPLFVLGNMGDTFESLGLHYFPVDVERSISLLHASVYQSCVFKCNGYVVAVVETDRDVVQHAALVPVVANRVLQRHKLILDIVLFVAKGALPYLQLKVLQRVKVIRLYVSAVKKENQVHVILSFGVNYGESTMVKTVKEIKAGLQTLSARPLRQPLEAVNALPDALDVQLVASGPAWPDEPPAEELWMADPQEPEWHDALLQLPFPDEPLPAYTFESGYDDQRLVRSRQELAHDHKVLPGYDLLSVRLVDGDTKGVGTSMLMRKTGLHDVTGEADDLDSDNNDQWDSDSDNGSVREYQTPGNLRVLN